MQQACPISRVQDDAELLPVRPRTCTVLYSWRFSSLIWWYRSFRSRYCCTSWLSSPSCCSASATFWAASSCEEKAHVRAENMRSKTVQMRGMLHGAAVVAHPDETCWLAGEQRPVSSNCHEPGGCSSSTAAQGPHLHQAQLLLLASHLGSGGRLLGHLQHSSRLLCSSMAWCATHTSAAKQRAAQFPSMQVLPAASGLSSPCPPHPSLTASALASAIWRAASSFSASARQKRVADRRLRCSSRGPKPGPAR